MRHQKWDDIMNFIDDIVKCLGGSIYDNRCGKTWDAGQAICAEAYGPNWMQNTTFQEWNLKDNDEPPEPYYYDCAKKMAEGYIPEWTKGEDYEN
jgi:hypothetical protein